ncbi:MAG: hypothetical protein JZD41_05795 [Thermoproteus sp.]|nr:hypothetical protein [Thermoproteus sp.]
MAKMAVNGDVGISADLCKAPAEAKRIDVIAYSESNGRVLLAAEPDVSIPGVAIGEAGGGSFELKCGNTILYKADVERIKELMSLDI